MATAPGTCDGLTSQFVYGPILFPRCFCVYVETIKYPTQCNLYDSSNTSTGALLLGHGPERSAALQLKLRSCTIRNPCGLWMRLPSLQIFHKRPHLGNQGSGTPALLDGLAGALPVVIAAVICALWSTAALGSTVEPAPRLAPHPG